MSLTYSIDYPSEAVFNLYAGADWSQTITPITIPETVTGVVMEIRNPPGILMLRLTSDPYGGIVINSDNSLTITIPSATTMNFGHGYIGSEIVVGYDRVGDAYPFDMFAQNNNTWNKILYGEFRVVPAITRSLSL